MDQKTLLVTGSSGLIGSEVVAHFANKGWSVIGFENNGRADFFGPQGDTSWMTNHLIAKYNNFSVKVVDIRNRELVLNEINSIRPNAIIHTAAQPSHDLAASRPFDDFDVNAVGTLNLLEATRRYCKDSPFVHMSTNKVYGDAPNEIPLIEMDKRWEYDDKTYANGINESFRIDQSKHSLFGASKLAADIMVQEYGRYFGIPTCILRGGCLTGPNHCGVELHGFLSYLIKCNVNKIKYNIYGYKGKQVRDNIHSKDVVSFMDFFIEKPRIAEVYNIGGSRNNSVSILEAFELIEDLSGNKMLYEYIEQAREGDHKCYISNISKSKFHYPKWTINKTLRSIFEEIYISQIDRQIK